MSVPRPKLTIATCSLVGSDGASSAAGFLSLASCGSSNMRKVEFIATA